VRVPITAIGTSRRLPPLPWRMVTTRPRRPTSSTLSWTSSEARAPVSSRGIAYLLTSDDTIPEAEQSFISRLLAQVPGLADCAAAAKRLNQVIRRNSKESLDAVLEDAAGTALKPFVASLRRDLSAVQAALDPWTTSPAEGQINRFKMLKRAMYGRAGFHLLRQRVLHAA